jgi:biopolymer transport protein TolR
MPRRTTIVGLSEIKEINLTPLMDLTVLLLITFIITFPMIEQGVPVNLPQGKADDLSDRSTRTITIDAQGRLFLDRQPIQAVELARQMKTLGEAVPDIIVMVRADEKVPFGRVAEVLRILHDAKITRLAVVYRPDGGV